MMSVLSYFAWEVASRVASKTCIQGFAEVLNRLSHALHYGSRVSARGVKACVAHQVFHRVRVGHLR